MPKRAGLTDKQIAGLERKEKRYVTPDVEMRGHYLRVPPTGPIVFTAVARDPSRNNKQIWATLGTTAELTVEQARAKAREAIRRIKEGKSAIEQPKPRPDSVAVVAQNWLARIVHKNGHRTAGETERIVKKYIGEHIGTRVFAELKRSEITSWLDDLEDDHGARMADRALSTLRAVANWHAKRDDSYTSPFVRGMHRASTKGRERVLDDSELRNFWQATEGTDTGDCLRLLLLTGQRRSKVLGMHRRDISEGIWNVPCEPGEKGTGGSLKLPAIAIELIRRQPRMAGDDRVFPFQKSKLDVASATVSNGSGWWVHDLRRTARSLMSRAGVQSEHAERVLGHVVGGVEGIYDRHSYDAEKAAALEKLAALIERIINPPSENVVTLR
jgi:integrase